jgi:hydrogenase maturation protease
LKTLVVGLGNPILGDDGVGWVVAEQLQKSGNLPSDVDVICLALGGISLMEALEGYQKAILIDAIQTRQAPIGSVSVFNLEGMSNPFLGHLSSAHDTSLQNALRIGRDLGVQLPIEIIVIAIEAEKVYEFSEELSPPVLAAVPKAVEWVEN